MIYLYKIENGITFKIKHEYCITLNSINIKNKWKN